MLACDGALLALMKTMMIPAEVSVASSWRLRLDAAMDAAIA
jgi:hypothetical protein